MAENNRPPDSEQAGPESTGPIRNITRNVANATDEIPWRQEVSEALQNIDANTKNLSENAQSMTDDLNAITDLFAWFKDGIVEMGEVIMEGLNKFAETFDEFTDQQALKDSRDSMLERERMLEESRSNDNGYAVGEHKEGFLKKLMGGAGGIGSAIMNFLASPLAAMAAVFGLAISATKLLGFGIIGAIAIVALFGALSKITSLIEEGREKGLGGMELVKYVANGLYESTKYAATVILAAISDVLLGEETTNKIIAWLDRPFLEIATDIFEGLTTFWTDLFTKGIYKIGNIEIDIGGMLKSLIVDTTTWVIDRLIELVKTGTMNVGGMNIDVIGGLTDIAVWMVSTVRKMIMGISLASLDMAKYIIPKLIELGAAVIKSIFSKDGFLNPINIAKRIIGLNQRHLDEAMNEADGGVKGWFMSLKDGYLALNTAIRNAILDALGIPHTGGDFAIPQWVVDTANSVKAKFNEFFKGLGELVEKFDLSSLIQDFFDSVKNRIGKFFTLEYWIGKPPQPDQTDEEILSVTPPPSPTDPNVTTIPKTPRPPSEADVEGIIVPPMPSLEPDPSRWITPQTHPEYLHKTQGIVSTTGAMLAIGALGAYQAQDQMNTSSFKELGIDPNHLKSIIPDDGVKKNTAEVVAEQTRFELMSKGSKEKGAQTNIIKGGDTVVAHNVKNSYGGYISAYRETVPIRKTFMS